MDIGIVSSRYAKALYQFAVAHNQQDEVYAAMNTLSSSYREVPRLSIILENPSMNANDKLHLLITASGDSAISCLDTFFKMVIHKGRVNMLPFIAQSFIRVYLDKKNMIKCHLTVPSRLSDKTLERIKSIVEDKTNKTVEFSLSIDPAIIGGFVLEYNANCLDASVVGQLKAIRKQIV